MTDILNLNPSLGDGTGLTVGTEVRIPPWNDTCAKGGVAVAPSPQPSERQNKSAVAAPLAGESAVLCRLVIATSWPGCVPPGSAKLGWQLDRRVQAAPGLPMQPITIGCSVVPLLSEAPAAAAALPPAAACRKWRVQAGDYLYAIATNSSTTPADIAALNKMDPDGLQG